MPADITGTEVLDEEDGHRWLRFVKGPIFANILLADEINRTPPKTQAALLEAMQEHQVTAAGRTYPLEQPFFVLATQNPIELEGTYPLPEAQLDRFMFNIVMTYLPEDEEVRVVTSTTGVATESRRASSAAPTSSRSSNWCGRWSSPKRSRATRCGWWTPRVPGRQSDPQFMREWVKWGAGLRASQALILAGKARALMHGPLPRLGRRYPGARQAGAAAPHHSQLLRRVGADHRRQPRRATARGGPGAAQRHVDDGRHLHPATCGFSTPPSSRGWGRWS